MRRCGGGVRRSDAFSVVGLHLRDHRELGREGLHWQRLWHELKRGRGGTWRVLVGQRGKGLQSRRRGEVGGHLGEWGGRLVW